MFSLNLIYHIPPKFLHGAWLLYLDRFFLEMVEEMLLGGEVAQGIFCIWGLIMTTKEKKVLYLNDNWQLKKGRLDSRAYLEKLKVKEIK